MQMSQRQMAKVEDCSQSATTLTEEIDDCIKPQKSSVQSCNCFAALNKTNLEKVINCSITEENDIARQEKKKCAEGKIYRVSKKNRD